jgi:signal transduction histidine kinase
MESEDAATAALRRKAQRLDTLAAVARPVQHDLNNLLTVVFANLDMLKRRLTEDAPQRQIARVQEAARRFEVSTRAMLSLCRRSVPGEIVATPAAAVAALQPLLALLLPAPGALVVEVAGDGLACRFDQALFDEALIGLARATAGRGALRITVSHDGERTVVAIALPVAAAAAAPDMLEALRSLAAAGSLAEDAGAEELTLRLALPEAPAEDQAGVGARPV